MFNILRMGCNTIHDSNFNISRPNGYTFYMLLLVKTSSTFIFDGIETTVPPGTIVIYEPTFPQYYKACQDLYKNDWIHFTCETSRLNDLSLTFNQPIIVSDPHYISNLIQSLSTEFFSNSIYKDLLINNLLHTTLIKIKELTITENTKLDSTKLTPKLIQLRSEIYSNPQLEWSIPLIAEQLNISAGYFQNIYKNTFNVTCISDVIESRTLHAKKLLTSTNLLINEISILCGYKTEFHFMRQFKSQTGFTPSNYRKYKLNNF